ncbi:cell wall protein [Nocardioides carbamazepini]|uniref:cell wall protein n=1 Tax=Nocardioides carbamazepini TaxID=2854259 RepID=UPI00214A7924|nr:cell wall protein [Nocardioides carbamazepini]MCR1785912.1 cell wall protein [Nocardioides carbamazepini]
MLTSISGVRRRVIVVLLMLTVAALLTLVGIGSYLAFSGQPSPAEPRSDRSITSPVEVRPGVVVDDQEAASLGSISEPEAFAEAVAHALFDWDTAAARPLAAYAGRLFAVADPTGAESAALVGDLAAYLPTAASWAQLKPYYTRQWLEIDAIEVPDLWSQAEAEAGPGGFAPGTTAYTVTGTRHRAGVWEGEDVTSRHRVAFTAFMVCAPTYPSCRLLRLSRLNEPLD